MPVVPGGPLYSELGWTGPGSSTLSPSPFARPPFVPSGQNLCATRHGHVRRSPRPSATIGIARACPPCRRPPPICRPPSEAYAFTAKAGPHRPPVAASALEAPTDRPRSRGLAFTPVVQATRSICSYPAAKTLVYLDTLVSGTHASLTQDLSSLCDGPRISANVCKLHS